MNALNRCQPTQPLAQSSECRASEWMALARRAELRGSHRAMFERALDHAKSAHAETSPPGALGAQARERVAAKTKERPDDDLPAVSDGPTAKPGLPLNQPAPCLHSGGMNPNDLADLAPSGDGGVTAAREGAMPGASAVAMGSVPVAARQSAASPMPTEQLGRFLAPAPAEGRWTFELAEGGLAVQEFSLQCHRFAPTEVSLRTRGLAGAPLQLPTQALKQRLSEHGASLAEVRNADVPHDEEGQP